MRLKMRRKALLVLMVTIILLWLPGCGKTNSQSRLLESERRLAGMYEACLTIKLTDPLGDHLPIKTEKLKSLQKVEVDAVLKRANGMEIPGKWAGVPLNVVLAKQGVAMPFRELRIEAWDGYVGRVSYDIASRPDTILAYLQDGKKLPRDDGPVRLVVASQAGYYWIRMIVKIEVLR
jgi:DMSO/TMAO reductase YedYZ molybdopterin-dependent catalytic subunit